MLLNYDSKKQEGIRTKKPEEQSKIISLSIKLQSNTPIQRAQSVRDWNLPETYSRTVHERGIHEGIKEGREEPRSRGKRGLEREKKRRGVRARV